MKSDQEIKCWIDNREVLTRAELANLICNHNLKTTRMESPTIRRWWDYILKTKDSIKLREYAEYKIKDKQRGKFKKFDEFKEIYLKDERLKTTGKRAGARLLKNVYNIVISPNAYQRHKRSLSET